MSDEIREKEKKLEGLKVEEEIQEQRVKISQQKALEAEAKSKYGRDWKKMIGGALKGVHINQDALQNMYSSGVGLKDYNKIGSMKRFK